ncbi:hypothetical protein Tco_1285577 [Tanacetum coccineum]
MKPTTPSTTDSRNMSLELIRESQSRASSLSENDTSSFDSSLWCSTMSSYVPCIFLRRKSGDAISGDDDGCGSLAREVVLLRKKSGDRAIALSLWLRGDSGFKVESDGEASLQSQIPLWASDSSSSLELGSQKVDYLWDSVWADRERKNDL